MVKACSNSGNPNWRANSIMLVLVLAPFFPKPDSWMLVLSGWTVVGYLYVFINYL